MKNAIVVSLLMFIGLSCAELNRHGEEEIEAIPESNRFSKEVFVTNLFEPTELVVLPGGEILFCQRRGAIMRFDPENGAYDRYDSIPVFDTFEHGLMGMALDPDFDNNQWIYLYYSPIGETPVQHLSRFNYSSSGLKNEKIVLKVPVQREQCCHTGGSVEFGPDGLLYLSTGDDTNPFASGGFAPIDDREGREPWDARRSSSNTNDLRGKILRIKPKADGSYSIPKGNLFEDNDPLTRPEIYVMGCRNPYRIAVDSKRGWLFWGDVGPDAQSDAEQRGPRGHDEFNVALTSGYFGWPLFVGDNKPYRNYSFQTNSADGSFDPKNPVNNSPNNTGLKNLPPAMPAKIFYPYANSAEFPQVKNGGRNAMAGPVYYSDQYDSKSKFPSFFNGRVFFYDWIRGFIYSLELDDEGNPIDWYPFMPEQTFNNLIDMTFGPDGQLYFIEYGTGWFTRNKNATLSRINYTGGNRPPVLKASLSRTNGKAPLEVVFDASESFDYDGDKLFFNWEIDDKKFNDTIFSYVFEKEGVYYPELILKDQKGNKQRMQFVVEVGNEAPIVSLNMEGNRTFFWNNRAVKYNVTVADKEDGALGEGISPEDVNFDIEYYQSLDKAETLGHQKPVSNGLSLIESLDCKGCHMLDGPSIGPSYQEVSQKYKNTNPSDYLSNKIINGGGGVWGEQAMSAHPELSKEDANAIVNYILSLADVKTYALSGSYSTDRSSGRYLFHASYQDKGKKPLRPAEGVESVWLRPNWISATEYDFFKGVSIGERAKRPSVVKDIYNESYIGFRDIDLTGIGAIRLHIARVRIALDVVVRSGKPDGKELGRITVPADKTNSCCLDVAINTLGKTDVYFVFEKANEENRLLEIEGLEFLPTKE